MAARARQNGAAQNKSLQFKLVLLGKNTLLYILADGVSNLEPGHHPVRCTITLF